MYKWTLLSLKNISTKLRVNLYSRVKIQTFTTGWSLWKVWKSILCKLLQIYRTYIMTEPITYLRERERERERESGRKKEFAQSQQQEVILRTSAKLWLFLVFCVFFSLSTPVFQNYIIPLHFLNTCAVCHLCFISYFSALGSRGVSIQHQRCQHSQCQWVLISFLNTSNI